MYLNENSTQRQMFMNKSMLLKYLILLYACWVTTAPLYAQTWSVTSPSRNIETKVSLSDGKLFYSVALDGKQVLYKEANESLQQPEALGIQVAEQLLAAGAKEILADIITIQKREQQAGDL